jgi:acetyltransferase
VQILLVTAEESAPAVGGLAEVLLDCVDGGASVGFLAPLSRADAEQWWGRALSSSGTRTWVAWDEGDSIIGCVQLSLASPANGQHCAEVQKLLVHRRARGHGVGTSLMAHVEQDAHRIGRTLLLLGTESGSAAEALYLSCGWVAYGTVASHARLPDGRLADTTFMVKNLDVAGPGITPT